MDRPPMLQTHPLLHRNPAQRIARPTDQVIDALIAAIERSHLNYGQIAEAAGVCLKTVSNITTGEVWPRRKTMNGLCRVLSLRFYLGPDDTTKRH